MEQDAQSSAQSVFEQPRGLDIRTDPRLCNGMPFSAVRFDERVMTASVAGGIGDK